MSEEQKKEAPAAQPKDAAPKKTVVKDPRIDTALHIIKGAIVKVLNAPLTTSTQFTSATKGRITVEYGGAQPTAEQIQQVEDLANEKIKANLQPQHILLKREEAEERFKDGVNGTFIYDKFKVPASVTEVTVVLWEGWNVNCCRGPHAPAGELNYLKIERVNYRDKKKELEFCFMLLDSVAQNQSKVEVAVKAAPGKGDAKKATSVEQKTSSKTNGDNVHEVSKKAINATFEQLFKAFANEPEILAKLKEKQAAVEEKSTPAVETVLTTLKNSAYTSGFQAGKGK